MQHPDTSLQLDLFPLAFPQLDDLDKVTDVGGVLSGLGKQLGHWFPVDLVDLFTSARVTMEKKSVVLISSFRLTAPPVHQQFAYSLLSTVDLVSYDASRAFGFPSQPFRSHLSIQLRRFGSEVVIFPSSRVPSHRHALHQRPQVQGVSIVSGDRPARLRTRSDVAW